MFTCQTLRALANDNSYRRGDELYDDNAVERLRRTEAGFEAVVQGSQPYRVKLRLTAAGPEFTCSCPYDYDGICKHSVAVGLAVLDAYPAAELTAASATPAPAGPALTEAVQAAWKARKPAEKLRFLEQALGKSDDLARQFLAFGRPVNTADPLPDLPQRLHDTLAALDFGDDLWAETYQRYEYDDEGDGLREIALERVSEALAPFAAELLRLARAGQPTQALRYWATACQGIYQVESPAVDDYDAFDDYGREAQERWQLDLTAAGWPQALLAAVLPPTELTAALAWLGQELAAPTQDWPDRLEDYQPVLQALAADATAAPLLPPLLDHAGLDPTALAYLRLRLAETARDDAAWTQAAEALLPTDPAVARQLLHFYTSRAEAAERLRVATAAFATWPDQFGDYALTHFTPATAPALYPAALRHRALANASLTDYERLRSLLSESEIASFVQQAVADARNRRGNIAFAAELLAGRADTDNLRRFVLGLEWLYAGPAGPMEQALRLLAQADPTALMLELEQRTRAYLTGRAGAKRGYALYATLATWLHLARHTAPRLQEPVLRLAQELREENPSLYALREELQKRQLLPAPELGAKKDKRKYR